MKKYKSLAAQEARLAFWMLLPAVVIVASVILFPVIANFWISFKSIGLGDLRPPVAILRERVVQTPKKPGDELVVTYQIRNSSRDRDLSDVVVTVRIPKGASIADLDDMWTVEGKRTLKSTFDRWEGGLSRTFELRFITESEYFTRDVDPRSPTSAEIESASKNALLSSPFTLDNFRKVVQARHFSRSLIFSFVYPFLGALISILMGIMAALLLNRTFRGQSFLRGLFLFPYISPIIAATFVWVFFLDPFSGTVNALLLDTGVIDAPIPFLNAWTIDISLFGMKVPFPLARAMVIFFDAWRYFPFAFLFILSRLQAIPEDLYEAADVDGAGYFKKFRHITLPQISSVLGTIFLLRFIWTFNKFDDVFLLTGGSAGTKTLPVEVYDNAFGRGDIGAGAATAVLLFLMLSIFMALYFKLLKEVDDE
ncbi:MAG TPA: sugar ABC transporter permease [Sphaerochaeta sp.]|nr:sugar ABC transporter permease [Sphaerochaeta sp.]HPY44845.1 sugar ABC transporter permease [Sphaerochaeta sp.]HQB05914.1 sugar ABC transporter permease [Sphaerochaeta sp.]